MIWPGSFCILLLTAVGAVAQGLPEPSITYYGVVKNIVGSTPKRLTFGTLRWTIQETAGALPLVITVGLTNINDQFSYVLRLPCETQLGVAAVSSGRLRLTPSGVQYTRSQVLVNGSVPATLVAPATPTAIYTSKDRGRFERLDLQVSIECVDSDSNTVCDDWEAAYFGGLGSNLNEDTDGDGLSNYQEYLADTNPLDPTSVFAFIDIKLNPAGGAQLRWSSTAERNYTVLRSSDLLGVYSPIRTGEKATANTHTFLDATAVGPGPFFYRLIAE